MSENEKKQPQVPNITIVKDDEEGEELTKVMESEPINKTKKENDLMK